MADRGTLERVSRAVYRVPTFPPSPYAEYVEASLWPGGVCVVISHHSALALYGFSDVSPSAIHITVPRDFRIRRRIPAHLVVHHAELADDEVRLLEGIPITTSDDDALRRLSVDRQTPRQDRCPAVLLELIRQVPGLVIVTLHKADRDPRRSGLARSRRCRLACSGCRLDERGELESGEVESVQSL